MANVNFNKILAKVNRLREGFGGLYAYRVVKV